MERASSPALAAILLLTLSAAAQEKREGAPDAAALKAAEKTIRDVFKTEYARKGPSDKLALAQKLLEQARKSKEDLASRYVLFREAQDVATQAGEHAVAFQVIDEMAKAFAIDPVAMKTAALANAIKNSRTTASLKEMAEAALGLAGEAVGADAYDAADKVLDQALAAAKKAGEADLAARVTAEDKRMADLKGKFDKLKKARDTLLSTPDDPAANLAVGQFRCLVKGDWEGGVPHIAKGSDAALKAAAEKDAAKPEAPEKQAEIGDAWTALSEKPRTPAEGKAFQERARHWYARALPKLEGLTKVRVERRLTEWLKAEEAKGVDLLKLIDAKTDALVGTWELTPAGALFIRRYDGHQQLQVPYSPPEEYDLKVVVEPKGKPELFIIGLIGGGVQFDLPFFPTSAALLKLDDKDATASHQGSVLAADKVTTILCAVRRGGVTVTADGKPIITWKGDYRKFKLPGSWKLTSNKALYLGASKAEYAISKYLVIPVTGQGQRLR